MDQTLGDYDLADALTVELVESGLVDLELRQKLCDPEQRRRIIPALIGTMRRGFGLDRAEGPELRADEFLVFVNYKFPSFRGLQKIFGKTHVSELFSDGHIWQSQSCCITQEEPGYCIMRLVHFPDRITAGRAIAAMKKHGYRPATHLEAYAFSRAYPSLQLWFSILALGSFVIDRRGKCCTDLTCKYTGTGTYKKKSVFGVYPFSGATIDHTFQFLFIRDIEPSRAVVASKPAKSQEK